MNIASSVLLAASLAVGAGGCVVRAHARVAPVGVVVVEEEPPPPRAVIVETRPGFLFIQGRWERMGGRWEWRDGYWERERAGYFYEPGRWERQGRGHVWVGGGWRAGGAGPAVRDHRNEANEGNVRDHRH
jgi:hypothetical protein